VLQWRSEFQTSPNRSPDPSVRLYWQRATKQEKLIAHHSFHLFCASMSAPVLDRIDRNLLARLQKNNRRPLRDLASEVGISAPTCLRRIRRLESLRVIRAHVALLDASRVGLAVSAFLEVTLTNASGAETTAFERRIQRCPEVIRCSELAGEVDYLLEVLVRDMAAFADFTRNHLAEDRRVKTFRSLVVLRQAKNEHAIAV
jgi:DNA-binding Lrp family transcriptional regulator